MTVNFYSVIKRENSTKQPAGSGTAFSCVLKDRSSIINPTIAIKMADSDTLSAPSWNYAQIDAYGRYYWVNNWTFEDRQWVASLTVDPLASFKTEIGALTKFVSRTGSDVSSFAAGVPDSLFPAGFYHADSASSVDIPGWVDAPTDGGSYVAGIVGADNTLFQCGAAGYGTLSATSLANLIKESFQARTPVISSGWSVTDGLAAIVDNLVKSALNPSDYIANVIWLPYDVGHASSYSLPYLGYYQTQTVVMRALTAAVHKTSFVVPCEALIGGSSNKVPNMFIEPYAAYYLEFWPFGVFPINGRTLVSSNTVGIQIDLTIDQITGTARFEAYRATSASPSNTAHNNAYLCGGSAQLGVTLPIGGTKANNVAALGTLLGSIGASSDDASGSYSVAGALSSGGAAALNVVQAMAPRAVMGGACSGFAGISKTVRLHRTQFLATGTDYADMGKAYSMMATLSTLSGFIQCWDGEIELANCTLDERKQIADYLTGGFFYE